MTMLDLNPPQKHTKNLVSVASTKEVKQQLSLTAAKMVNAQCPAMMGKIVAKKKLQKWSAVKMVNVPKKAIVALTAVRNLINIS